MKRDLVKIVLSQGTVSDEILSAIGSNLNQASAELLAKIPKRAIKKFLKAQRKIKWSLTQQRELVKIQLGDKKVRVVEWWHLSFLFCVLSSFTLHYFQYAFPQCTDVSGKDLLDLQSTVAGASRCMFESIKPEEVLQDEEGLRTMSQYMKKWQIKALLKRVSKQQKTVHSHQQGIYKYMFWSAKALFLLFVPSIVQLQYTVLRCRQTDTM